MKEMKVIDLLVKIANWEEVPKKIKYGCHIYELVERGYDLNVYKDCEGRYFEDDWFLSNILNDKIEIIEDTPKEDKKIEKLKHKQKCIKDPNNLSGFDVPVYYYDNEELGDKINEIIDKVNGE